MGYRNKTYVIFDADNDMWAYAYMKGWNANDHIAFDFHDAHDLKPLTDTASEETVKQRLRERLSNAKQVILLVGANTKNLYRFVRWEIETSQKLDLPIIIANLNDKRRQDDDRCPALLRDTDAVHVSFKMKIIKHALDNFPDSYHARSDHSGGARHYPDSVYDNLGL